MVRIRLRRGGRKKAPVYRLVVADARSPRNGKFIEIIGQYAPRQPETGISVNTERALYWLSVGAQPSDTARSILRKAGVMKVRHERMLARKLNASAVPVAERPAEETVTSAAPAEAVSAGSAPAEAPSVEVATPETTSAQVATSEGTASEGTASEGTASEVATSEG